MTAQQQTMSYLEHKLALLEASFVPAAPGPQRDALAQAQRERIEWERDAIGVGGEWDGVVMARKLPEAAVDALREAALNGVRQVQGRYADGLGGYCAMGIIIHALYSSQERAACARAMKLPAMCPHECANTHKRAFISLAAVVEHMNDTHGDDFLTIATKLA